MAEIYVIGGVNLDIYAKSHRKLIMEDSNISDISFSFGGVGHNIAEDLAYLDEEVHFLTAFGNDPFALMLKKELEDHHVNISYAVSFDHPSSVYLAVMDREDMKVAMCDMSIMDLLGKEHFSVLQKNIKDEDFVFIDTNLPEEMIVFLFENLKGHKIVDAISANKVKKALPVLSGVDIFKMNRLEAEAVSGTSIDNDNKVIALIKILLNKGVKEVLITVKNMLFIGYDNKVYRFVHDDYKNDPVNVTGAGDALLATYAFSRFHGGSIEASAALGLTGATLTVDSNDAVAGVNRMQLRNKMNTLKIKGGVIYEYQN